MNRNILAHRCFQVALLLGIVGLALTGIALYAERQAQAGAAWHDPGQSIRPSAIAPDLALLTLAGIPDDQILALAVAQNELETVHALLAFSGELADQQRINGWLWLASRYHESQQLQRAAQAYRLAGQGALLSGHLPDLLRVETLLTTGRQLIILHDKTNAHHFLQQAALIGIHAPQLTEYHRRSLLERLISALLRAGGQREDWAALGKTVKHNTPQGQSLNVSPTPYSFTETWDAQGTSAALIRARDDRRSAAGALVAALSAGGNVTHARQTLRQALLAEDQAIIELWTNRQDTDPAVAETRLHWLLLKRQVAAGGAGDDLMPEWTAGYKQIEAELTAAWAEWLSLQHGNIPATRWALMAAYWGLYPNAPVVDLVTAIRPTRGGDELYLSIVAPSTLPILKWNNK